MKIVDLNVLLYVVNRDAVHHRRVLTWWEEAMNGDVSLGLPWVVVLGFLRLSTSSRVFPAPLSPDESVRLVDRWLASGNAKIVAETEGHWGVLRSLIGQCGTGGNLTTDAHLAALAITRGAILVSCDADFSRFPGLRWENPLR